MKMNEDDIPRWLLISLGEVGALGLGSSLCSAPQVKKWLVSMRSPYPLSSREAGTVHRPLCTNPKLPSPFPQQLGCEVFMQLLNWVCRLPRGTQTAVRATQEHQKPANRCGVSQAGCHGEALIGLNMFTQFLVMPVYCIALSQIWCYFLKVYRDGGTQFSSHQFVSIVLCSSLLFLPLF